MDVQKRQMKNGLTIASEVMPHLRSASLGVWVKCGSRVEQAVETGISHFIEHLLSRAPEPVPPRKSRSRSIPWEAS